MVGIKTKQVDFYLFDDYYEVECIYEEDDPGFDDEWIPDMATLEKNGEPMVVTTREWSDVWGKAHTIANEVEYED